MVISQGGGEILVAACRFVREETPLDQVMRPPICDAPYLISII